VHRLLWAALVPLALIGAARAEDSAPGEWIAPEVMEQRDWSTACEEIVPDCTAVSVSRAFVARITGTDPGDYAMPKLWVMRRAGAHTRPRVFVDTSVWGEASELGALSLHVYYDCDGDCTGRAYRLKQIEKGRYELAPEQVAAFFAESAKTGRAATRRADGSMHGIISTSGLIAALRWMDESQGRTGTVTAILAKGSKAASAAPPVSDRRKVKVVRGRIEPSLEVPNHPELMRIRAQYCPGTDPVSETNIQRFRLINGHTLWSIICAETSHNPTYLWLVEYAPGRIGLYPLPRPEQGRTPQLPILPHSTFDPASGQLTGYYAGQDLGSCGWKRRWAWTGQAFDMIDAIEMPACIGIQHSHWLQTYRAVPQ
jgi:hypothetical protein